MIIESKYDLQETIDKMQNNTCTYEQYKPYLHLDGSMLPRYVGTVTEEGFHLQKAFMIVTTTHAAAAIPTSQVRSRIMAFFLSIFFDDPLLRICFA